LVLHFDTNKCAFVGYVLLRLWGWQQLFELRKANHHPQKRPLPRQAGLMPAIYGVALAMIDYTYVMVLC
jgi:hypothetical protein